MNSIEAKVLPTLYLVLFGFIITNLILNLCLYSFTKIKSIQTLSFYWASLIFVCLLQGSFQENHLHVVLAFSATIVPICFLGKLLLEPLGLKAPLKIYFLLWLMGIGLTFISSYLTTTFFGLAIPISLTMGLILLHVAYTLSFLSLEPPTKLQHLMSFLLFLAFIHNINFAIFRGDEGNQIWGWATAFAFYQLLSFSVLSLIFEQHTRSETKKLEKLVSEKTIELSKALKMKEKLIRIVLHDIAGPIQGQTLILSRIQSKQDPQLTATLLPKLSILTELVRNVIQKVFSIESLSDGGVRFQRSPVSFDECLCELRVVFEPRLGEKNISLEVQNEMKPETNFLSDQIIFTTSILGNLISNSIKFSLPGKKISIHAWESDKKVFIDIIDSGIGIPQDSLRDIFDSPHRSSRPGTLGEPGSGFGLSQVQAYLEQLGGEISIESRAIEDHPFDHGTIVHLIMEKFSPEQKT
jgi:signal transduction histidine kinase